MRILLLDTAHRSSFVGLAEGEKIVGWRPLDEMRPHSEVVASVVKEVVAGQPLDLIAVGVGPGSYTGLRVALSLAKGINLATGVPLLPFYSLQAYPGEIALFDARAGGVYALEAGKEPAQYSIEELKEVKGQLVSPDGELISERLGRPVETVVANGDYLLTQILANRENARADGMIDAIYLRRGRIDQR